MKKILISVLFIIICFNLIGKDKRPDWIDNPEKLYPNQLYISAVGISYNRTSAENSAIGNISRIFESKVKASNTLKKNYREILKKDKTDVESTVEQNKKVRVSSEQDLFNIQFGKSFVSELGQVYVIAYIDRMKTGDLYEIRINENIEKINYFLEEFEKSDDDLKSYSLLKSAKIISEMVKVQKSQLQIIFPSFAELISLPYSEAELDRKLNNYATKISFSVVDDTKIDKLLRELLTTNGFSISDNGMMKVQSSLKFEEVDLDRENIVSLYWELNISVLDDLENTVLSFNKKGRETKTTIGRAKQKAVYEIEKILKDEFYRELEDKLFNR